MRRNDTEKVIQVINKIRNQKPRLKTTLKGSREIKVLIKGVEKERTRDTGRDRYKL